MTPSGFDAVALNALTPDVLRGNGSLKWTAFAPALGAWVAEMDLGVAPPIREALIGMVDHGRFGYTSPALSQELAQATAGFVADRYGWSIDPAMVALVPDVLAGLAVVMDHYARPGAKIILPTPCYMPFVTLPGVHGHEVIQVPMQDGVLALDDLAAAFDQGGQLLIWCDPHNPTGRVASREEMTAVAELVASRGGLVFSDEIHAPLVYPDARHVPFASVSGIAAGCTITAMSASKAWNLAGLKCAQLVFSNPAHRASWDAGLRYFAGEPAMPGILANIAAYTAGGPWLADALSYLDANRRRLTTRLQEAEARTGLIIEPGQATYLAWIDARKLGVADAKQFLLERAGVAVNDGALCGDAGRGYLRLNYATPTPVLDEIIDRILTAVEDFARGEVAGRRDADSRLAG